MSRRHGDDEKIDTCQRNEDINLSKETSPSFDIVGSLPLELVCLVFSLLHVNAPFVYQHVGYPLLLLAMRQS